MEDNALFYFIFVGFPPPGGVFRFAHAFGEFLFFFVGGMSFDTVRDVFRHRWIYLSIYSGLPCGTSTEGTI